ncbi:potassium channel family protein [Desulforamulus reducens]|uniref:potassium channel family protein n=1 Tax=Desulforamulus reducens TaxID=59610 RepID=UPI00059CB3A7|nr:potassium channel family protein [Desulforamulus reducens]
MIRALVKLGCLLVIPALIGLGSLYALLYKLLTLVNPGSFHGLAPDSHNLDFLYYSLNNITTTGYGDIYPLTKTAKFLSLTEIILGLTLVLGAVIFEYFRQRGLDKRL